MARKRKHEEHLNHEAWAIPYGDLITLLLAFFVVMYSMSSVNEGKYRVLADSLNEAFGGSPRTAKPIQVGPAKGGTGSEGASRPRILPAAPTTRGKAVDIQRPSIQGLSSAPARERARNALLHEQKQIDRMADDISAALGELVSKKMVAIHKTENWIEVEIQTDILFASGSSQLGQAARPVLDRVADALIPYDNRLRIEGHTDNVPISTREFPSNWELSSARAATVVHLFMARGVDPRRMTVQGLGEYQPIGDNGSLEGRNRNRRVMIVILSNPVDAPPTLPSETDAFATVPDAPPPPQELAAAAPAPAAPAQPSQEPPP